MPFTTKGFKDACHERATCVAVLTTKIAGTKKKGPIKATVVTEHSAAFPPTDEAECYVSVVIGAKGEALKALTNRAYFGLSFLSREQLDVAHAIYNLDMAKFREIKWRIRHQVPYIVEANASIISSVKQIVPIGPNVIVIGHVMDVVKAKSPARPLVNYQRTFRSVDDEAIEVKHPPRSTNTRL